MKFFKINFSYVHIMEWSTVMNDNRQISMFCYEIIFMKDNLMNRQFTEQFIPYDTV